MSPAAKVLTTPRCESHRKNDVHATVTKSKLDSLADLPAFIGAGPTSASDIEDEEALGPEGRKLYEENMVIVDGWRTSFLCCFILSSLQTVPDVVIFFD